MRNKCPICKSLRRTKVIDLSFIVPEGWTLPAQSTVYECDQCRFTYYDNAASQEDYDIYYRERYGYGVGGADTTERMEWIAKHLAEKYAPCHRVLDFGSDSDEMRDHLHQRGFDAVKYGLNSDPAVLNDQYDMVILSHILEHVYDLDAVMAQAMRALRPGGLVYVEVPDHGTWRGCASPLVGFHQKHINHFRQINLDALFMMNGCHVVWSDPYYIRRFPVLRTIYMKQTSEAFGVSNRFYRDMNPRIVSLADIKMPVIVWGLGDISWYLLDKVPDLNVVYYVDNDPAYRGATIRGVPVHDKVTSDEPIVVMAVGQADALIERIRSECNNEVIVI